MKKFLLVLLAVGLTFAMIGCDKGDDNPPDTTVYVKITYSLGTSNAAAPASELPAAVDIATGGSLTDAQLPTISEWTNSDGIKYTYANWMLPDGTAVSTSTTFNAATTITVKWTTTVPNDKALVIFDLNYDPPAGTARVTEVVLSTPYALALPSPAPQRTGLAFGGWYSVAIAGIDSAEAGTKYNGGETLAAASTTRLYAKWNYVRFAVTFINEGTTQHAVVNVREDYPIGNLLPANPVRAGYEFFGWQVGAANTTDLVNWDTWTAVAPISFYARWWSTNLAYDASDTTTDNPGGSAIVEKVVLENQSFALYKFTIPAGKDWEDYEKVTVDYKVPEASLHKEVSHYRLMGAYTADQFAIKNLDDGGKPYDLVTEDENGVFSVKLISGSPYNGGYIMDNKGGNHNSTDFWTSADFFNGTAANAWKTMEYRITGDGAHPSFEAANKIPGTADDQTFYLGVGLTSSPDNGAFTTDKSDGSLDMVGSKAPIVHLIRNVTLVGKGTEPDVIGQIPANTAAEPSYVAYLTPIVWNYRGDPADPVKMPISTPYTVTNPQFTAYGNIGGETGNSFEFSRGTYSCLINWPFPVDPSKFDTITINYTVTKATTQTNASAGNAMKLIFSSQAVSSGWTSGTNSIPETGEPNRYRESSSDGVQSVTYNLSDFNTPNLSIQHNDGNSGLTHVDNVKFTITINSIVFDVDED